MVDEAAEAAEEDGAEMEKVDAETETVRVACEDTTKNHGIQKLVASSKRSLTATPKTTTATTVSIIRQIRTWLIPACHV